MACEHPCVAMGGAVTAVRAVLSSAPLQMRPVILGTWCIPEEHAAWAAPLLACALAIHRPCTRDEKPPMGGSRGAWGACTLLSTPRTRVVEIG